MNAFTCEQAKLELSKLDLFKNNNIIDIIKISKGKINHIYLIKCKLYNVILKQSLKHASAFKIKLPIFKLPLDRLKNEVMAMKFINKNVKDICPNIFYYDNKKNYFIMEDLTKYVDIRDMILDNSIPDNFSEKLALMLSEIYKIEKQTLLNKLKPVMKKTLKKLLFNFPYSMIMLLHNRKKINFFYSLKKLKNRDVKKNIKRIKKIFLSENSYLMNGDLHLGSITYYNNELKLYDYEFAFYGPLEFDFGRVIAQLIVACISSEKSDSVINNKLKNAIKDAFDYFIQYNAEIKNIQRIKSQLIDFCGIELISRATGLLELRYTKKIENIHQKKKVFKKILDLGTYFICNSSQIRCGEDILKWL